MLKYHRHPVSICFSSFIIPNIALTQLILLCFCRVFLYFRRRHQHWVWVTETTQSRFTVCWYHGTCVATTPASTMYVSDCMSRPVVAVHVVVVAAVAVLWTVETFTWTQLLFDVQLDVLLYVDAHFTLVNCWDIHIDTVAVWCSVGRSIGVHSTVTYLNRHVAQRRNCSSYSQLLQ